jgi:hypothetical protein
MYIFSIIIEPCEIIEKFNQNNTPTKLEHSDVISVLAKIKFLFNLFIFIILYYILFSETPKKLKRKFYVEDIKSPDLATSKRAKRSFNKARLQIITQRKKINFLHQTIRRLRKKFTSLQKLIEYLKSINLISEQAHDDILVFICEI